MKKFINWIGCKKKLLPQLLPLIPKNYKTYYEPFLGSGALYLALMPKNAILNDVDHHLISIWKSIIDNPKLFYEKTISYENDIYQHQTQIKQKASFQTILKHFNDTTNTTNTQLTKSSLFFILTKYAFRSILRFTKDQILKTHFSYKPKFKTGILNLDDLITLQKHFIKNNHILLCHDYQKTIQTSQKDDFLFIDPPYYSGKEAHSHAFYQKTFDFKEQTNLYNELQKADQRGVKWLYTNFNTKEIRTLFKNYHFKTTKTSTSSQLTNQNNKQEIIITNYKI
ncbi:Dam family site-specific DNA-(adenine-N6)-methyltransferase [Candidatus Phytoplasma meliae]|uniref:Site-specific DNA-methyltransferase (adenine-specific) n=1 Tax=Candidatus Phytoplasma meliae TaxID=1848402 RepID=A0ABS5CXX1_9MOLU|nr:Dam family site-specific DNA-(adenine-N6)-methyltransferase [Candidatus Phytoplasma meliae]MBP5835833.1 Dam family site-specific DNA-(adenine-N6)-methyltransferase [Candidatus Phytoplasma meliae]